LNFLCDVDGVLADFLGSVCEGLTELGYPDIRRERVTQWDIADCLDVPTSVIYNLAGREGFCEGLDVLPGAVALIQMLREHGKVYFATSPIWSARTWMYERTRWLKEHFDAKPGEVLHTSAKELVRGDMLIDDKPQTVERWALAQGREPHKNYGVVWNQPYNATYTITPRLGVVRAQTWDDVNECILKMKAQRGL